MAITGTFLADFSAFQRAVTDAQVKLRSFETDANKVSSSLSRMTDSFSGRKVIQDATLMTEAINRLGGATTLTAQEQAKVNAVVTEGIAKYTALGKQAPKAMVDLAEATKQGAEDTKNLNTVQTTLIDTLKKVALGVAALFTVRAAFNFGKDILASASALKDLSAQTHIGVEELQLLTQAVSEFGVDTEELGKGLFTLSQRIAGGDESVARGLHAMGLSLKDVEGLQGEALFLKIEHGLSTLQGSLRDTAAADLFGSKLGAAMAGASDGIDDALDSARRLNTVINTESIDALDAYGEAIERMGTNLKGIAANMVGPVAEGFNTLNDAAGKGASKWAIFVAMLKDWAASNVITGPSTANLAKLLDELNQKVEANAKANRDATGASQDRTVALTQEQQAAKFMTALQADVTKALTDTQRAQLAQLKTIGQLNAANAAAIGVNAAQYAAYVASVEARTKKDKEALEASQRNIKAETELRATSYKAWADMQDFNGERAIKEAAKHYEESQAALARNLKIEQEMRDRAAAYRASELDRQGLAGLAKVKEFYDRVGKYAVAPLQTIANQAAKDYAYVLAQGDKFSPAMREHFRQVAEAAQKAANGTRDFGDILKSIGSIVEGIQNDFAQMASVAIRAFQEIQKIGENTALSLGDKFSSVLATGLAAGASIFSGTKTGNVLGGAAAGAAFGSLFGPIGAGVGAGVGAIAGLFGKGEKGEVDEMRQAFIDQIGGWHELNKAAEKAGITLTRVLNAKTVKEYEKAIDELTKKMEFQDAAMATLRETAEKYGFTLQELGPKFAAAELDEKAQELYKDFQVLTASGIDIDTVIGKMSGSINDFVQKSVAMGIAVPNAMRPMIERMIQLGLLTDINGDVIKDLEDSGIEFSMTMSEGFKTLIDAVKELTDAIRRGLGLALEDVANQVANFPDLDADINVGRGKTPSDDTRSYAKGTGGRYLNFGSGTPAILHGWEKVTPLGAAEGGIVVNVYGSVTTERDLIESIRRGLNDAPGKRRAA